MASQAVIRSIYIYRVWRWEWPVRLCYKEYLHLEGVVVEVASQAVL